MNVTDLGYEILFEPILKVRLRFMDNRWYVEYRRRPKYYLDKWWWFDDSKHVEYNDAYVRAQTLAAEGAYKILRRKDEIFNVTPNLES
jgi:hypothetical protein